MEYDTEMKIISKAGKNEDSCKDSSSIKELYKDLVKSSNYEEGKPQRIVISGRISHGKS
jgi:hypothetical protein